MMKRIILDGINGKLEINIIRRNNPSADNYCDINWLDAEVAINVTGFNANYFTFLRADDFQAFYNNLEDILADKTKNLNFMSMEEGLKLNCNLDISGKVLCAGEAKNEVGNILIFNIDLEYEKLKLLFHQLKNVVNTYPVLMKDETASRA